MRQAAYIEESLEEVQPDIPVEWGEVSENHQGGQMVLYMHPSFLLCIFLTSSPLQKPGDGWAEPEPRAAVLPPKAGRRAEGRLAEEAEEHHEKLAAALVRAPWGSAFLLQGQRWDQAPGEKHMARV